MPFIKITKSPALPPVAQLVGLLLGFRLLQRQEFVEEFVVLRR